MEGDGVHCGLSVCDHLQVSNAELNSCVQSLIHGSIVVNLLKDSCVEIILGAELDCNSNDSGAGAVITRFYPFSSKRNILSWIGLLDYSAIEDDDTASTDQDGTPSI